MVLTVKDLIGRGYLHDHTIPPLTTKPLADKLPLLPTNPTADLWAKPLKYSQCVLHSVPKRRLSRRMLSIPNPQHQIPLCIKIAECWHIIDLHFQKSMLSLSTPEVKDKSERAVGRKAYFRDISMERVLRSSGCTIHLYADFTRYYSSIYTHSIAWSLHGKKTAQDDKNKMLAGNQLDTYLRATQARQSIGLPVGPDSSLILAEVIGTPIDERIQEAGVKRGLRYIDDYHLYFSSRAECERAITNIHRACLEYELDINDSKTIIEEMPDSSEPPWKLTLRSYQWGNVRRSDVDIMGVFDLAFQLASERPDAGILRYAVGKSREATVEEKDWDLYQALLCRCMIVDPLSIGDVLKICLVRRICG